MPQISNQQKPVNRPADVLVQKSETRVGAMALISKTQVKLWKAMLVSLFVTGFIAAITFVVGIGLGDKSDAAGLSNQGANLVPGSEISSPVFCKTGECWSDFKDGRRLSFRQFGSPYINIELPGSNEYLLTKLVLSVDPTASNRGSLPKDFHLEHSLDCKTYSKTLSGVKDQTSSSQHFTMPPDIKARCLRLYVDSNYGDPVWTTLSGVQVWGY